MKPRFQLVSAHSSTSFSYFAVVLAVSIPCVGLFPCFGTSSANAHDGEEGHSHSVVQVQPAQMYAPTAMPDRIVLTWSGDPRTTQSVTWRTSTEVAQGIAEITVAEPGPYFPEKAKQHASTVEALKTDLNTAHFHSVTFTQLLPGTKYVYRVGDGTNWSEWFQFDTASAGDEPFSFIYFGDAQNNLRSMWSRVVREAYRDAPKAAFLLHAGDLVNTAESDGEWGEWFGAGAWLNAMTPNVAIPGNHEQAKTPSGARRLSHHWRPSFTFPENGPEGLEESCYTLTYQNLRLVCMDSNALIERQAEWLEKVLSANELPWVVCSFHHPVFSTGRGRDNPELRTLWKPIFDKYKVDLVLQGHDHTYGRTGFEVPGDLTAEASQETSTQVGTLQRPRANVSASTAGGTAPLAALGTVNVPTGVQQVDERTGTVYVVSVSGPKMYNHMRQPFMKRIAEDTQLYQVIHIDGGRLRFEARTAVGELYDAFELHKQGPGQINKLVEIPPEVPQYLRPEIKE